MRSQAMGVVATFCLLAGGCGAEVSPSSDALNGFATGLTADGRFPESFLFGSAVAGFQVEMGCPTISAARCDDARSDWYQWINAWSVRLNPLLHQKWQGPKVAPGFFELFPEDIQRADEEVHHNALRVSIEWSRIFPSSTRGVEGRAALQQIASAEGIAFYHRLFGELRARGLTPLVTVNHYSLPLWIHDGVTCNRQLGACDKGGWVDRQEIVTEIAKYAGFVAAEYGDEVDLWATLNEPFTATVIPAYLFPSPTRVNPPGLYLKVEDAKTATLAMIEAHARMYDAIHAADASDADGDGTTASVGLVYNLVAIKPNTSNAADARAAENASYILNQMFLDGVIRGDVDREWNGEQVHREDLAGRMDYLGVNYYAQITAQANVVSPWPLSAVSSRFTFNPLNLQNDMNYPRGLYEVLKWAGRYGLPMMVTETGAEQAREDDSQARWLAHSLEYTRKAMAEGADVRGYFLWTLMDNYEWNHGMDIRFGLYRVDPNDPQKRRVARSSVEVFRRITDAREVPADLRTRFSVP